MALARPSNLCRASELSGSVKAMADAVVLELVARLRELVRAAGGERVMVGVVGKPGSGKSTLTAQIADVMDAAEMVVLPMDGYHLAQVELERLGRAQRKGALDTFDAGGFVSLLERVAARDEDVVYAPAFHRNIEEPIAGAIAVARDVPLVIVEGNYLLVDTAPWDRVREILDETWMVQLDEDVRVKRLIARHMEFGRDAEAARAHALGSDQTNAEVIGATAHRADLVVDLEGGQAIYLRGAQSHDG